MWELYHEEGYVLKNWCFWTVVLDKTLGNPLDCKEIKPVNPRGNQSWIFIGKTDAEAEVPILWPPDVKNWLIGKDPDAGKDWGQEKKMIEDEMVGWYHWFNGHELEQTPGDSEGQESLVCYNPWGCKEFNTTEWLNNKKVFLYLATLALSCVMGDLVAGACGYGSLTRDWTWTPCTGNLSLSPWGSP